MRIISGKFKNRRIKSIDGVKTRPLCNNIQESIFNIIRDVEDINTLELYAGFGLFSWECLSRGAANSVLVEKSRKMANNLSKISKTLGVENNVEIIHKDIFRGLKLPEENFNLIFADPPFYLDLCDRTIELVLKNNWLAPNGVFIIRHYEKEEIRVDEEPVLIKKYGESIVRFYKNGDNS